MNVADVAVVKAELANGAKAQPDKLPKQIKIQI
jgi:hypothetical protein